MLTIKPITIVFPKEKKETDFFKSCREQTERLFIAYSKNEIDAQFRVERPGNLEAWDAEQDQWWKFLDETEIEEWNCKVLAQENQMVRGNLYDFPNPIVFVYGFELNTIHIVAESVKNRFLEENIGGIVLPIIDCQDRGRYDACCIDGSDKLLISESNYNQYSNANGYTGLNDEEKLSQICQLFFYLATAEEDFAIFRDRALKVGTIGLSFEEDLLLTEKAKRYTYEVFKEFATDSTNQWEDYNNPLRDLYGKSKRFNKDVYNEVKSNSEDVSKEVANALTKSHVSPWTLFSEHLLNEYYESYVKEMTAETARHGQSLGYVLLNALKHRFKENMENYFERFKNFITNELVSNYQLSTNNGLVYYKKEIEKIKKSLEKDKCECQADTQVMKTNFLNNPPITPIPKAIRRHYEDYAAEIKSKPFDPVADKRGNTLLEDMKKKLEYHPTLLSLLVRAVIIGVLLMSVGMMCITYIGESNIVNLQFLVDHYKLTMGILLGLPILIAFFHYGIVILRSIRQKRRKYLAWMLFRVQLHLFHESVIPLMEKYYDDCAEFCQKIISNIETIQKHLNDEEYINQACDPGYLFQDTYFMEKVGIDNIKFQWVDNERTTLNERFFRVKNGSESSDWFKEILSFSNEEEEKECMEMGFLFEKIKEKLRATTSLADYHDMVWVNIENGRYRAKGFPSCQFENVPETPVERLCRDKNTYMIHFYYVDATLQQQQPAEGQHNAN